MPTPRTSAPEAVPPAAAPDIPCVAAACPLCDSEEPRRVLLKIRHLSPFNPGRSPACRIEIVRCNCCGMMRLDPRPDGPTLARLQRDGLGDSDHEAGPFEAGNSNPDYTPMLARRLWQAGFPETGGRLLDVGCGSGNLLAGISECLGAQGTGLDISKSAIERARSRFPEYKWVLAAAGPEAFPRDSFDAVTLVHALEHSPAPRTLLATIRSWLKPGGILAVEVPNGEFYFSGFYSIFMESPKPLIGAILRSRGRRVPFTRRGFYPYHLSLFGPGSLRAMAEKAGLEVLGVEISTCRLEWWIKEARRDRDWTRYSVNRIKAALARRGLGDNLLLTARRPPKGSDVLLPGSPLFWKKARS